MLAFTAEARARGSFEPGGEDVDDADEIGESEDEPDWAEEDWRIDDEEDTREGEDVEEEWPALDSLESLSDV